MACCGVSFCCARCRTRSFVICVERRSSSISSSAAVPGGRMVVFGGCVGPWHVHRCPNRSGSVRIAVRSSMMKVPEPFPLWPYAYFIAVKRSRVVCKKKSSVWFLCTASRMDRVWSWPFGRMRWFWRNPVSWVAFGAIHTMSGWIMRACARTRAGEDCMGRGGQAVTLCCRVCCCRCGGAGPIGCGSVDAARAWMAVLGSWSRRYLRSGW